MEMRQPQLQHPTRLVRCYHTKLPRLRISLAYNAPHSSVCVCAGDRRGQHRLREDVFPAVLREALRGPRGGGVRAGGALAALPRPQPARPILLGPLQTLLRPPGVYSVASPILVTPMND